MGIKNLNKFLTENCSDKSIKKCHLNILQGKTIVIDTSIYLYKFMENSILIENMYLLISIFLYYNITPIFIFDGKPPKEKLEILEKRKIDKKNAENKYNNLKNEVEHATQDDEKNELIILLNKLKKQFVRIKKDDIETVKTLMKLYGVTFIEADGEADKLCAEMVITNKAWACLSDDMDLFVYGCTRVLRHLSLINHTVIYYNINSILKELHIPLKNFKEILVLSGTDYNIHNKISLNKALKYYQEWYERDKTIPFYTWLENENKIQIQSLIDVLDMFNFNTNISINTINNSNVIIDEKKHNFISNTYVNKNCYNITPELKKWLYDYGFIFIDNNK